MDGVWRSGIVLRMTEESITFVFAERSEVSKYINDNDPDFWKTLQIVG